jgi:hypothetical protein
MMNRCDHGCRTCGFPVPNKNAAKRGDLVVKNKIPLGLFQGKRMIPSPPWRRDVSETAGVSPALFASTLSVPQLPKGGRGHAGRHEKARLELRAGSFTSKSAGSRGVGATVSTAALQRNRTRTLRRLRCGLMEQLHRSGGWDHISMCFRRCWSSNCRAYRCPRQAGRLRARAPHAPKLQCAGMPYFAASVVLPTKVSNGL